MDKNKKIVIVGKLFEENKNNGPGHIIFNLLQEYKKMNIEYSTILYDEKNSKYTVIKNIISRIFFQTGNIVNVHTDGFFLAFLIYCISKINKKNDYYLTIHGLYAIESKLQNKRKKRYLTLEKKLYRKFDNLICVSNMLKNDIFKSYGYRENVFVIGNGTDAISYNLNCIKDNICNCVDFLMTGGINNRKGIIETLNFVSMFKKQTQIQVRLTICGKIENEEIYNLFLYYSKKLHLDKCINYLGMISDKKNLYYLMAKSHFHLCLSKYDTFNVSVIEGVSMGCPPIVSKYCGSYYLVEKFEMGFIVDLTTASYNKCICKIENLIKQNNYPLLEKKTLNLYKFISWEAICKKYLYIMKIKF